MGDNKSTSNSRNASPESKAKQGKNHQSHIQIPKQLLRKFEREAPKGFLTYYDVQKKFIGTNGHAQSLNTEENYYSNKGEQYWSSEVESALGKLLDALHKVDTDQPRSTLPSDFDSLSKKYLHSLMARSPRAHKKAEKSSIYLQLVDKKYHHDISSTTMYALAQEEGYFKEWIPTLLINKTSIPFLLPMCGYIEYAFKNIEGFIAMPVDPHKAILLVPPEARNLYCEEDHIKYGLIDSDAIIKRINVYAFETQVDRGYGYIISNNRETLTETAELFKQSKPANQELTTQNQR